MPICAEGTAHPKAPPPRRFAAFPSPSERGVNSMGYRIFHFSLLKASAFFLPFYFFTFKKPFYLFTFKSLWSTPHIIFSRSEAK